MKFLAYINEEWAGDVNRSGKTIPVYLNPTSSDYSEFRKWWRDVTYSTFDGMIPVRFIGYIENNQAFLYVFSADHLIHNDAIRKLNLATKYRNPKSLRGEGVLLGNIIHPKSGMIFSWDTPFTDADFALFNRYFDEPIEYTVGLK